jgi:hypothetical protein
MEKTWKPTTAGILCIVAGAIQLILGLVAAIVGGSVAGLASIPGMGTIVAAIAIPILILGIISIIGGIYALKRKLWGLALAGSITSLIGPWLLGIPAIIFVILGKNEFK